MTLLPNAFPSGGWSVSRVTGYGFDTVCDHNLVWLNNIRLPVQSCTNQYMYVYYPGRLGGEGKGGRGGRTVHRVCVCVGGGGRGAL